MTNPIETCKTVLDTIRQYNKTPERVFEYQSCLEWAAKCEEKADVYITAAYYPAVFTQEACRTAVPAGHLKLFSERMAKAGISPQNPVPKAAPTRKVADDANAVCKLASQKIECVEDRIADVTSFEALPEEVKIHFAATQIGAAQFAELDEERPAWVKAWLQNLPFQGAVVGVTHTPDAPHAHESALLQAAELLCVEPAPNPDTLITHYFPKNPLAAIVESLEGSRKGATQHAEIVGSAMMLGEVYRDESSNGKVSYFTYALKDLNIDCRTYRTSLETETNAVPAPAAPATEAPPAPASEAPAPKKVGGGTGKTGKKIKSKKKDKSLTVDLNAE